MAFLVVFCRHYCRNYGQVDVYVRCPLNQVEVHEGLFSLDAIAELLSQALQLTKLSSCTAFFLDGPGKQPAEE